jgi:hypothetical protein
MRQHGKPKQLRHQSFSIRRATSHPKSTHKHRSSPFRHKPCRRRYTSPGSLRLQQYIRPLLCSRRLSRSLPKYTLYHPAKHHKQWRKGLRLCRHSFKLSFSSSSNPTAFQVQSLRPNRRGTQVKVHPVGCRRISLFWGLRLGVKDRSSTSSTLLKHQPFGHKHQHQASE